MELHVTENPGYLHFRVTGENTQATVRAYLAAIHTTCIERGCVSILIEENLAGPGLGLGEIFQIVSAESTTTAPAIRRVAFVDINPAHNRASMQFAEDVAVTRGVNMRVFDDVASAKKWLAAEVAADSN